MANSSQIMKKTPKFLKRPSPIKSRPNFYQWLTFPFQSRTSESFRDKIQKLQIKLIKFVKTLLCLLSFDPILINFSISDFLSCNTPNDGLLPRIASLIAINFNWLYTSFFGVFNNWIIGGSFRSTTTPVACTIDIMTSNCTSAYFNGNACQLNVSDLYLNIWRTTTHVHYVTNHSDFFFWKYTSEVGRQSWDAYYFRYDEFQ